VNDPFLKIVSKILSLYFNDLPNYLDKYLIFVEIIVDISNILSNIKLIQGYKFLTIILSSETKP